jgi:hypothetical protein
LPERLENFRVRVGVPADLTGKSLGAQLRVNVRIEAQALCAAKARTNLPMQRTEDFRAAVVASRYARSDRVFQLCEFLDVGATAKLPSPRPFIRNRICRASSIRSSGPNTSSMASRRRSTVRRPTFENWANSSSVMPSADAARARASFKRSAGFSLLIGCHVRFQCRAAIVPCRQEDGVMSFL